MTNDDGFDSIFLKVLVRVLVEAFEVTVVAPQDEKSWIGRAVTRRGGLAVTADRSLGCKGYRISGTPTDCVNLALGHLVEGPPDVVVSGINIGFNTTQPLIYSSGTVAGALEGAFWGYPALALSQMVPEALFDSIHSGSENLEPEFARGLEVAARRAIELVRDLIGTADGRPLVHNVNFPVGTREDTPIVETVPVGLRMGCLFEPVGDVEGAYEFRFRKGHRLDDHPGTDIRALEEGRISRSLLDFSRIGVVQ